MKVVAFIITALINVGIGFALFFMLLLSLNGFSEDEADPGLILFVVWVALTALVAGVLSFFAAGYLINKKSFRPALAALAATAIFVVVGAVSQAVGFFAAVGITSSMR